MAMQRGLTVRRRPGIWYALLTAGAIAAPAADARIVKIEITSKESPTYSGASFGSAGQFEKLIGKATGELDPTDRHNAIIQDIGFAPLNANGRVQYVATFTLVKPIDLTKSNGTLFYNVNNRGNRNFPYNLGGDPGDGFVQGLGYTLLWSGWQAGIAPAANVSAWRRLLAWVRQLWAGKHPTRADA